MMMRPRAAAAVVAVLALAVLIQVGCDKAANPLAPSATVVTVTASPSRIALTGERSRITVIGIKPDGNPVNPGTQFTLTTTLGVLRPTGASCSSSATVTLVEADGNGQAQAELCGDGEVGDATVRAALTSSSSGGGGGTEGGGATGGAGSGTVMVSIGESDTSQPSVLISANPSVIAVGGDSMITLIGRAADGSPVAADSRIRLTADLGTLRCTSAFACPGESSNPCSAVCTDSQGEAEAIYTAGDRSGAGEITAILGTGEPAMITVDINAAIDSLGLEANPRIINRTDAGVDIELTAIAIDTLGNPLSGIAVRFSSGAGTPEPLTVTTNSQGIAASTLNVTRAELVNVPEDGTFLVTASATSEGTTETDDVEITVQGAP